MNSHKLPAVSGHLLASSAVSLHSPCLFFPLADNENLILNSWRQRSRIACCWCGSGNAEVRPQRGTRSDEVFMHQVALFSTRRGAGSPSRKCAPSDARKGIGDARSRLSSAPLALLSKKTQIR